MATYTAAAVERLLSNYLDIRYSLEGGTVGGLDNLYVTTAKPRDTNGLPLGQTKLGSPWPFMQQPHAKPPMDGKRRAQLMEDLHVSCLDIECGLKRLSNDDIELLYKYHILKTHTLDDLVAERQTTSRGSMQRRVFRAVQRLTKELESRG